MTRLAALLSFAVVAAAQDSGWLTVEATAYCPCALCCDTRTERTADGTNTNSRPYGIAASKDLPFGLRVHVPRGAGYLDRLAPADAGRWWPVDDRGGALDTERRRTGLTRIDLRFRDHADAKQFGRRTIAVYVTEKETK